MAKDALRTKLAEMHDASGMDAEELATRCNALEPTRGGILVWLSDIGNVYHNGVDPGVSFWAIVDLATRRDSDGELAARVPIADHVDEWKGMR